MNNSQLTINHSPLKKVPHIRFKGFEGEWESCELGEITTKIGSGKTPRGGKTGYLSIGIPLIRSQNIFSDSVNFEGIAFISDETDEEMSNSRVLQNDVLLNITGASIGRSAVYRSGERANVNQHVCIIRANGNYHSDFIQLNLASTRGQAAIDNSQAGGAREGLNFQQIGKFSFQFPSLIEQTQIGKYFRELDSLIRLHQRKHDKLVTLKKAMLQKMFPQPGATTPEIRFKSFSGEWVEKRLVELCELFTDGDWIESKDQSASGIRLLQTGNVGVNEFIDKADKSRWISLDTFERLKCEEVYAGDILISRLPEPAGRACVVPKLSHRAITAVDCTIVRTAKSCDPAFLVQHLSLDSYFETVNNYLGGGTRQRISRSVLGKLVIQIPNVEEQQKIGTYFRTLDALITKHATQLQKLQQIKSACLEKMFV